jgi:GNAT superfamily N-acetyltransferase
MASPARLRRGTPEDAPALLAIVQAGFETYRDIVPPGWEPPDQSVFAEPLAEELADPATFCRVAEAGGEPVGVVTWLPAVTPSPDGHLPEVHFRHLFVLEAFWGSGVAVDLHSAAVAEMRSRGVRTARLYTPADQPRARRFYEREGWTLRVERYFDPKIGFDIVEYGLRPSQ